MFEWFIGIAFGMLIHEGAHQIVADVNGGRMEWTSNGEWIYRGKNAKAVALAGLASQAVTSEILLTRDHQTNFTKGWLAFNVGNTVSYSVKNEITPGGYGDLGNFTRDEARNIEIVLLAHSASVAHRLKWQFLPTRNGIMFRKEL